MAVIYFLPLAAVGLLISVFIRDFVMIINRPAYFPVIHVVPLVVGAQLIASAYLYFAPGLLLSKQTRLLWDRLAAASSCFCAGRSFFGFVFPPSGNDRLSLPGDLYVYGRLVLSFAETFSAPIPS